MSWIIEQYYDLMNNRSDQRVKDWLFMSSPLPTVTICLSYALLVTKIGPKLMENRKAFDLNRIIIVYNLVQVILSSWMFYQSAACGWLKHYSYRCQPVDYSNSPEAVWIARMCWCYYMSKFLELLDTVFFVLRKKNNQITTLHVIHHGCMPISVWVGLKFTPGGHSTFFGYINSFVHIVMYSYYLLAALGPQYKKYLWWKKYLTVLQMAQFVIVFLHAVQLFFTDCDYPIYFAYWIGGHAVMFLILFYKFYDRSYRAPQKINAGKYKNSNVNGRLEGPQKNFKSTMTKEPGNNNLNICFPGQEDLFIKSTDNDDRTGKKKIY